MAKTWATPCAADGERTSATNYGKNPTLVGQAKTWGTPCASDAKGAKGRPTKGGRNLPREAEKWATPVARDAKGETSETRNTPSLPDQTAMWPTATATDAAASARHGYMIEGHAGTTLTDAMRSHLGPETLPGGESGRGAVVLSPVFVETLMGFPAGWTEIASSQLEMPGFGLSETPSSPSAPRWWDGSSPTSSEADDEEVEGEK